MKFLANTKIDFLRWRKISFGISTLLVVISVVSLFMKGGPNFGIDFTGGTLMEVSFSHDVDIQDVRKSLVESGLTTAEVQSVVGAQRFIIRVKEGELAQDEAADHMLAAFSKTFPDVKTEILRVEYVGAVVGHHLVRQATFAIFWSLVGIIIYVAFRFKNFVWGVSGVIALAHDVFLTIGFFSIINAEVTLTIIAAFLTIAGYSINDTIVVFDRIRENNAMRRKETFAQVVDRSLNETLSRTIVTSMTTLFVVLALLIFGGTVIHDFALALFFGIFIGTYSSLLIATPIVYVWYSRKQGTR